MPKIEFLKSKGISDEVAELVSKSPSILARSLENFLVPSFDLFGDILQSEEEANGVFRRSVGPVFANAHHAEANIEVLKHAGVPIKNIKYFVSFHTKTFLTNQDKFRQIVEEVKKFGFNPLKLYFFFYGSHLGIQFQNLPGTEKSRFTSDGVGPKMMFMHLRKVRGVRFRQRLKSLQ